jgi:AraC family transcriptional regulator
MSTSSPLPLVESGSRVAGATTSSRSAALAASNVHYLPFRRRDDDHYRDGPASDHTAVAGITPAVAIAPREVASRRARSANGIVAEIIQMTRRERIDIRFRAPFHLLVVVEQGGRIAGETLVEGCPRSTLRDLRRKLTFVPAGHAYHEWQDPSLLLRAACFYLDPAKLPAALEPGCEEAFRTPRVLFEDAALWETALKLRRLLEAPDTDSQLCFEALGVVLTHELARANAAPHHAEPRARGGLAGWQRRIVTEYIEAQVAEPIPLAELAKLVQLSPYHFCRAFKQSFGVPPHRYHTGRRIERAKAMLAEPNYSVTEIGLSVGFSETSSFTAAFRKATGLTPTAYHRTLG